MLNAPVAAADSARADALFQEGRAAAVAGDFVTARAKFVESQRLDPAVGTLLNIADCEEHLEHPVAALSVFRSALPQLDPSDDRFAITKERIDALEKRAPRLTVTLVAGAPAATRVLRDGVPIHPRDLGVPALVEPGPHVVTIQLPGAREHITNIAVRQGQSESVVVDAARLVPDLPREEGFLEGSSRVRVALVALGIGAVGIALAGVSWAEMLANSRTLERACDGATKVCSGPESAAALDAQDAGRTWRVVNYVSWGVGLVGLGTGAYLLLTGGSHEPRAVTIDVVPLREGANISALAHF